jgi:glucose uptake protein GlcU
MSENEGQKSWWSRTFGRSILSVLIGHFFADKNNAASIIAILLVMTLCYVVAFREKYEYVNGMLNIVFVVIGYYFGSKRHPDDKEEGSGT